MTVTTREGKGSALTWDEVDDNFTGLEAADAAEAAARAAADIAVVAACTAAIASAIAGAQPVNANLTAIAGLTGAADRVPYFTGSAAVTLATLTTFGRSVIAAVNAAALITVMGLGSAALANTGDFDAAGAASAVGASASSALSTHAALQTGVHGISVAAGKTLTASNTITFTATDGSTLAIGAGGTLGSAAYVATGTSGATIPILNVANTWGATQTITPAANANGLNLSTSSTSGDGFGFYYTPTWNSAGNQFSILVNATNTASGSQTAFAWFGIGSAHFASIGKAGNFNGKGSGSTAGAVVFGLSSNNAIPSTTGIYGSSTAVEFSVGGTAQGAFVSGAFAVPLASVIGWAVIDVSGLDTGLARNAAGVVEVNNGTAGAYRDILARTHTSTLGTITTDINNFSGTATWNNGSVTFTGLKLNIVKTAAANASNYFEFQVGGNPLLSLNSQFGQLWVHSTVTSSNKAVIAANDSTAFMYAPGATTAIGVNSGTGLCIGGSGAGNLGFRNTNAVTSGGDCGVGRNAADVVEINSGTLGTYRDLKLRTAIHDVSGTANTAVITGTGYNLTGSNTVGAVDIAGIWNSSGLTDFFAIRLTDTARHSSSKVFNIYTGAGGATSVFSIDRLGNIFPVGIALNKIGFGANATNASDSALGQAANASGGFAVAIGSGAAASGLASMALGFNSVASHAVSIALGEQATTTAANQLRIGSLAATDNHIANISQVAGTNGQVFDISTLTELTTIAAAGTTDTTIQMPAGAIVLAVSARVTTAIPDATSFDVGDSGSASRFSTASVGVAANSTNAGTKAGAYYNAGALSVRLTMNGTPPATNTGRVRITIHYLKVTPPTS